MKIIRNKYIPFKGFRAINLFGVLFVRGNAEITERVIRHETIHTKQMQEMLYIFFYLWYCIEYVYRVFWYAWKKNKSKAESAKLAKSPYHALSFEREAYANETKVGYPSYRKFWNWTKYF